MDDDSKPITLYLCYEPDVRVCADRLDAWTSTNREHDGYNARDTISVDSPEADGLKHSIHEQIAACDVFVCIIAGGTFHNEWINWELREALAITPRKGFVGILLKDFFEIPDALKNQGAMFTPFMKDNVEAAIEWAAKNQPGSEDYTLTDDPC